MKWRACLMAISAIADDPRVRRQGDALRAAGWNVTAVGLLGARSPEPSWPIICVSPAPPERRLQRLAAHYKYAGASFLVAARFSAAIAEMYHRQQPLPVAYYGAARNIAADLYVANDWWTLPVAARLAAEHGGRYAYDSHELSTAEYGQNARWRHLFRPYVRKLERKHIRRAAVISTVSEGIAKTLKTLHGLAQPIHVIRSLPKYEECRHRPTNAAAIKALYHGLMVPDRGLEELIISVKAWRPEYSLALRGSGMPDYIAHLKALTESHSVSDRVSFLDPVNMVDLITAASVFDIGVFAMPNLTLQSQFVLPNKLFEYIMAGLAICVTDLPEMAHIVRRHDLGALIAAASPAAIADAVNRLTPSLIDAYKKNSLTAARELCWEQESRHMLQAYRTAVGDRIKG